MVIDLARYREVKIKNRITAVGIEVEGGWQQLPSGTSGVQHDGSVLFGARRVGPREIRAIEEAVPPIVGELASPPLTPRAWQRWCEKFWPSVWNETCGLHVHMSLTPFRYSLLMSRDYMDTLLHNLRQWAETTFPADHPIFPRLAGENEYCTLNFWPDAQANTRAKDYNRTRPGNRYTAVNYCYALHSTVEVRVLPMMSLAQGTEAIQAILWVTNAFLLSQRQARRESVEVEIEGELIEPVREEATFVM